MHHDWIFEVLDDLRSYALRNGLTATAAQTELALHVARAELGEAAGHDPGSGLGGAVPHRGTGGGH